MTSAYDIVHTPGLKSRGPLPLPGHKLATAHRNAFIAGLHGDFNLSGDDMRFLFMPAAGDTLTSTSLDRDKRTLTWNDDTAANTRHSQLGMGLAQDFEGTVDEGDTSDVDDLSFGDGVVDSPFSVLLLVKADDPTNGTTNLIAKSSSASAQEWEIDLRNTGGEFRMGLYDESASARIEVLSPSSIGTNWTVLVFTYDGTGALPGMAIYVDGLKVAHTTDISGTYIAMENTAGILTIGARFSTKAQFFNGKMALVLVAARQFQPDEIWAATQRVNSFFDLSL